MALMGESRNAEDAKEIEELRLSVARLGIKVGGGTNRGIGWLDCKTPLLGSRRVRHKPVAPEILSWLGQASIGLSTIVDDPFGTNVVKFMVRWIIPSYPSRS